MSQDATFQKFGDATEREVIAAALVIQQVSSGPDFVGQGTEKEQVERINRVIADMRSQPPGTGWSCFAHVAAQGVLSALKLLQST